MPPRRMPNEANARSVGKKMRMYPSALVFAMILMQLSALTMSKELKILSAKTFILLESFVMVDKNLVIRIYSIL